MLDDDRAPRPARALARSTAHWRRARERLPLGVASTFRYWGEGRTIYVREGRGGRIRDLDGHWYWDYRLGYGPAILGYADARVDEAARRGMAVGGVFALSTEGELAVAERIARLVPAAEMVRFSNSGTEAVMAALRLARAHTGREGYVLVEGGYHGLFDAALWMADVEGWDGRGEPDVVAYSRGVPLGLRSYAHLVPMNDPERLEDRFRRHGDRVAALLVEPILGNCCAVSADAEYVRLARSLCDRHGALLVIDEVKTGFRVGRGGVQGLLGVTPDLTTFAKAMGNGYPIAAVAGRREVMEGFRPGMAAHGGTYTAHPVSLAASGETLRIIEETDALEAVAAHGAALKAGMGAILAARGVAHSFSGHDALFGLFLAPEPPRDYRAWKASDHAFYDRLAFHLHDEGVIVEPDSREPWFPCEAHRLDPECLPGTLGAFERAVDLTLEALA